DLFKPGYRNVDLTEVELVDSDIGLYEFNEVLLTIRKNMVDRKFVGVKCLQKYPLMDLVRIFSKLEEYTVKIFKIKTMVTILLKKRFKYSSLVHLLVRTSAGVWAVLIFDKPICEKDLIQSLVFDAKVIAINNEECKQDKKDEDNYFLDPWSTIEN
ncbi:hypothetical protein CDAR_475241, partial [Caerostris darwini]